MLFEEELVKAADVNEIVIQTRITETHSTMIDAMKKYYRTRNAYIECAFRRFLQDFSHDYQELDKELTDELVKKTGNDRATAIRALFKARSYPIVREKKTIQINLKISKAFALDLRAVNDLTMQIEDTSEFVDFCCTYLSSTGFLSGLEWLRGCGQSDVVLDKDASALNKCQNVP